MNYWVISVYVPSFTSKWVRRAYPDRKIALAIALTTAKMFPDDKVYLKRVFVRK